MTGKKREKNTNAGWAVFPFANLHRMKNKYRRKFGRVGEHRREIIGRYFEDLSAYTSYIRYFAVTLLSFRSGFCLLGNSGSFSPIISFGTYFP